jgi:hypothetical protein
VVDDGNPTTETGGHDRVVPNVPPTTSALGESAALVCTRTVQQVARVPPDGETRMPTVVRLVLSFHTNMELPPAVYPALVPPNEEFMNTAPTTYMYVSLVERSGPAHIPLTWTCAPGDADPVARTVACEDPDFVMNAPLPMAPITRPPTLVPFIERSNPLDHFPAMKVCRGGGCVRMGLKSEEGTGEPPPPPPTAQSDCRTRWDAKNQPDPTP